MSDIVSNATGGGNVPPVAAVTLAPAPVARVLTPAEEARQLRFKTRVWSLFTFVMCAGMLMVGLWLKPNSLGVETHRQLGLPPCGFYYTTGLPCPTCGCTTAVSHFSHGEWIASLLTQPFGFAVALVAALLVPLTLIGAVSGKWVGPSMFWLQWHWRTWVYGGLGILAFGWAYKIVVTVHGR